MKKIIILLFVVTLFLAGCGSSDASVEYDTAGGFHAKVFEDCPTDYAAAAADAIQKAAPGADTSSMAPQDFILTEYDNGIASLSFQNATINGKPFGGEIYMEMDGNNYKVHYLQIANKEYINDGIDLSAYDKV